MRILGVLNHKGGTGKTTTTVNLAAGLAEQGAKVLCIDLDAQGNLSTSLGVSSQYLLTHLLMGQAQLQDCITPARKNLDIISSDVSLLQAEGMLWRLNDCEAARLMLRDKLQDLTHYDFVILDYSPSASLLSQSGLLFIHELIVPVATNYLALMGTRQVVNTLKEVGRLNHHMRLAFVVPTFYYGRLRKDREVLQTLSRHFNGKVTDPIRANVKLAESPGHQKTIFEYAPHSSGAEDYRQLVKRVLNNG